MRAPGNTRSRLILNVREAAGREPPLGSKASATLPNSHVRLE
jgi:hypothetical protein